MSRVILIHVFNIQFDMIKRSGIYTTIYTQVPIKSDPITKLI